MKTANLNTREYLAARIKTLRIKKGLSQTTLAELANVPRSNISKIEAGKYSPGVDLLQRIAAALDVHVDMIEFKDIS